MEGMTIARAPLRITLGGGATDLPSYSETHGGFCLTVAIDRYVHVIVRNHFENDLIVKYSRTERVSDASKIEHPIIRETFAAMENDGRGLEVVSMADVPAGTGLGSSGSFTVALVAALSAHRGVILTRREIAEKACEIEIDRLKEPIGRQDQWASAFGGVRAFHFGPGKDVTLSPPKISKETLANLEDSLMLFHSGQCRSASEILKDQHEQTILANGEMLHNLLSVKNNGLRAKVHLENGRLMEFAECVNFHWHLKKARCGQNPELGEIIARLLDAGALAARPVGAGQGGFIMSMGGNKSDLRRAIRQCRELRFRFDQGGVKVTQ